MNVSRQIVLLFFQVVTHAILRIHAEELERVPRVGPLIIVTNHVNILEIPVIYAQLQPRKVHGLVLASRWRNPIFAWGLNACGALPLERGEMNLASLHQALDILNHAGIVIISPEGTRSKHGRLQKARPGVVTLSIKSMAPLLPVVYHGSENYANNLKRLRRTDFYISVGKPFCLRVGATAITQEIRKKILDEIMYQLAATLPPQYRGHYADIPSTPSSFIEFL